MAKARRMKEKEPKNFPKLFKYFLVFIILVAIVFFVLFYLIKTNKIAFLSGFFENIELSDVEIFDKEAWNKAESSNVSMPISGIDNLEITNLDIKYSKKLYIIKISFNNTSDKKISNKKVRLLLYNDNQNLIYSSTFSLPDIDANSQKEFNIYAKDKIEHVANYKIEYIK